MNGDYKKGWDSQCEYYLGIVVEICPLQGANSGSWVHRDGVYLGVDLGVAQYHSHFRFSIPLTSLLKG